MRHSTSAVLGVLFTGASIPSSHSLLVLVLLYSPLPACGTIFHMHILSFFAAGCIHEDWGEKGAVHGYDWFGLVYMKQDM